MKISSTPLTRIRTSPSTKFRDNHQLRKQPANNKKGYKAVYVYTGDWYVWQNDASSLKKLRFLYVFSVVSSVLIFLISAVQFTDVNMSSIVAVPSLASIIPMFLVIYGTIQLCRTPKDGKMTVMMWSDAYRMLRAGSIAYSILMFIAVGACVYRFFIVAPTMLSIFVFAGYLVCAVLGMIMFASHKHLKYKVVHNPERDKEQEDEI
ncbi:MAG: hypothetical protein ACI3VB_08565 [Oscillospiraceae bacterium]